MLYFNILISSLKKITICITDKNNIASYIRIFLSRILLLENNICICDITKATMYKKSLYN